MKKILAVIICTAFAGCATLPESVTDAIANASAGCAKATGLWGSITVMTASADKGVIHNGEVTVADNCGGIAIKDAATIRIAPIAPIK